MNQPPYEAIPAHITGSPDGFNKLRNLTEGMLEAWASYSISTCRPTSSRLLHPTPSGVSQLENIDLSMNRIRSGWKPVLGSLQADNL
ncbi:hypothetical protein INR49_003874 [Caranx melampygus]|nr:hypothetical protein INR49_003874 [Caranx melampygus]